MATKKINLNNNTELQPEVVLDMLAKRGLIAENGADPERIKKAKQEQKKQAYHNTEMLLKHYYIDAIDDRGVKVGSKECEEGKMFLIPQIWAVFSGVSRMGRETVAMDAVEKYLSDPLGTVISSPAYTKWDENIGFTFISVLFLSGLNKKKRRSSQCRVSSTLK